MKKVRILSIDGGGIRGVIPAVIINYIEKQLQVKTENPKARIADFFDLIAGTSTGGILCCIYLSPSMEGKENEGFSTRFSASEALDFYTKEGFNIFNASKNSNWKRLWGLSNATEFSPNNIEKLFNNKFGDLLIENLTKPCIITTYDMKSKSSYFFSSREPVEMNRRFFVRDVVRSTSAAPTFFPPAKIKNIITKEEMVNIDGGVFANNPSMCAYAEARNTDFPELGIEKPSAKDMLILSLGTGGGSFKLPDLSKSPTWGVLKWAKSIPEIMMDGSVDTVAFQMKEIFETLKTETDKNSFLRVDVPGHAKIYSPDMSDASPENIEKLKSAGEITLEEYKNKIDQFINKLII